FLKAVQLDRFHHLLSEIIAVGLSHRTRVSAMGTLIVYVLISLAAAISLDGEPGKSGQVVSAFSAGSLAAVGGKSE
ncbi:MAG TPA: hypothetical protein V6C84_14995, partial [Coleofasciculaceae cyanobacterium]